jgi:hypothetical protein
MYIFLNEILIIYENGQYILSYVYRRVADMLLVRYLIVTHHEPDDDCRNGDSIIKMDECRAIFGMYQTKRMNK